MKKIIYLIGFLFLAVSARAQISIVVAPEAAPVQIKAVDIKAEILANMAFTAYDITFYNPNDRILEGKFSLALAENQRVLAFALDVNGKMRDGVPADITLPAKDMRRALITVEENLKPDNGAYNYVLPLDFGQLADFSLRVDARRQATAPRAADNPFDNFGFTAWNESFTASFKAKNYTPSGKLNIAVPMENTVKVYTHEAEGNTYFFAAVPAASKTAKLTSVAYDKKKVEEVLYNTGDIIMLTGILNFKEAYIDLNFTDGETKYKQRVYLDKKHRNSYARNIYMQQKTGIIW